MFRSQYRGGYAKPEINHGKRMVETAGYIPAPQRIQMIMDAGRRLVETRKEQFDFYGEIDESFEDRTRRKDYDMAEAFQDAIECNARIRAFTKAKEDTQTSTDKVEVATKKSDSVEE